jgi:hypothetical protein
VTARTTDEVLAQVLELLPDVPGVERFVPLTEEDLGPCTEPRGAAGHAVSFRTAAKRELDGVGVVVTVAAQQRVTAVRQALARAGLGRGRVAWHVAECHNCGARRVRPSIVVRMALGGPGAVIEREYGASQVGGA